MAGQKNVLILELPKNSFRLLKINFISLCLFVVAVVVVVYSVVVAVVNIVVVVAVTVADAIGMSLFIDWLEIFTLGQVY